MQYYTWYTVKDSYGSDPEIYYIYNLPIRDPSDDAEAGFFLSVYEEYKDDQDAFDDLKFTFNNANLDSLKEDGYKELKDQAIKNLLWKQVLNKRRGAIEYLFTSTL